MGNIKTTFIASSSGDVQFYLNSKKLNPKNTDIIATTLDAYNKLRENKLEFEVINYTINPQTVNVNYKETAKIVKKILKNRTLREIFAYRSLDLFDFISYDLYFFVSRMLLGYEMYLKTPKLQNKSKVAISKTATDNFLKDVTNNDFIPFVLKNILSSNTVEVLKYTSQGRQIGNNGFINALIRKASFTLFVKRIIGLPQDATAVFLCPGSHAVLMAKIFKELAKRKIDYVLIAHNLTALERIKLKRYGVNFIDRLSMPLTKKDIKENSAEILNLIEKRWQQKKTHFKLGLSKKIKNELLEKAVSYRLKWFLKNELDGLLIDYFSAQELFKHAKPKILITTTDPNIKVLPFIKTAQKNKIKTVTLQHGAYAWVPGANFRSDKIFVWGNYYLNWFAKNLNKSKQSMHITGSAFFDNYAVKKRRSKRDIKSVLILMALPSVFLLQFREEFENLINMLASLCVKKVYLRSHPWQDISGLMGVYEKNLNLMKANKKGLDYYVNKSDAVITMNTTAGFNALTAGKPLIYWDFIGDRRIPFATAGIPAVRTAKEAGKFIEKYQRGNYLPTDKKRRALLKQIFFKLDGLSSVRIADKISEELNKSHKLK